jgi:hypothetical protein
MVRFVTMCLTLSLTACTRYTENRPSQEFVGHTVSEAAVRLGPPTTKIDLGNDYMAFTWSCARDRSDQSAISITLLSMCLHGRFVLVMFTSFNITQLQIESS